MNDTSKARRHYCAGHMCPGYAWRASEHPHPHTCAAIDTESDSATRLDCIFAHEDTPIPFTLTDKARAELAEPGRLHVGDTLRSAANIAVHYERPELASLILDLASRISESEASR